jgi:hypothetical protein
VHFGVGVSHQALPPPLADEVGVGRFGQPDDVGFEFGQFLPGALPEFDGNGRKQCYEKHDIQALYDLAGELEPEAMAELEGIETPAVRKLRQQILQVQRRLRRVKQQMKWLRQENTARLYHRAQRLEEAGDNWWDIVRRELEAAIERRQTEIIRLQKNLARLENK